MSQFDLVTLWRIGASLGDVWDAVVQPAFWPQWWRGLEEVAELERGDADGIHNRQRFIWKGALPYRLVTEIKTIRLEPMVMIAGEASGDVAGLGVWRFTCQDGVTVVRYEWQVRAASPWFWVLANAARPLVRWNHGKIMEWGAHGLARRLGAGSCSVERNPSKA